MRQIKIPFQSDRIIGFTIPRGGVFYVCDHDEVTQVQIAEVPVTDVMDQHPYDLAEKNRDFVGLLFTGFPLNAPLKQAGGSSIEYDFNPKRDYVKVKCNVSGQTGEISFRTLSGDWFCASLSDDGHYLVLAEPYELALYQLVGRPVEG